MKPNFKTSGILFFVAFSLAGSLAQSPSAPAIFNPTTGQPIPAAQAAPGLDPTTGLPATPMAFDPTTGQPIQPGSDWRDPNWGEPDIVLTNVSFPNLPISEVARNLEDQFKGKFDIILPTQSTSDAINPLTGLPLDSTDWTTTPVRLQLRNVMASEVFNAMNLMFENDRTPLRWELKMLNNRPIALLRVLTVPNRALYASKETQRRVYFVGNLIGDEKNGGMTMEEIIKTVTDVLNMAQGGDVSYSGRSVEVAGGKIQFHMAAQLLVVTGTHDQIDFMEQTLQALREKVDQERAALSRRAQSKAVESKSKPDESGSPGK